MVREGILGLLSRHYFLPAFLCLAVLPEVVCVHVFNVSTAPPPRLSGLLLEVVLEREPGSGSIQFSAYGCIAIY